jgi:enoyl-CoA hydratase
MLFSRRFWDDGPRQPYATIASYRSTGIQDRSAPVPFASLTFASGGVFHPAFWCLPIYLAYFAAMNSKALSRKDRDSVAVLTFERSSKLNALNYELVDAIVHALDEIEAEDDVRVVVLTGSGRAFSAGADIREFSQDVARGAEAAYRHFVRRGQGMTRRIESFPKPVISAINGLAYGGGCEIVEATHLSIAVPEASFAKSEIALGMPPCFGGTQRLPRLIGRKRALQMLLTAAPISAEEAERIGLINGVVPSERLIDEAVALGLKIARFAPTAVASCLHAVTRGLNTTIDEGLAIEAEAFARTVPTAALRQGLDAFINASKS